MTAAVKRIAGLAVTVLLSLAVVTGCAGRVAERSLPTADPSTIEDEVYSVLVAGDSLASGGSWDAVPSDPGSWTVHLGNRLEVTGGWRRDGVLAAEVAMRMPHERADALIIMIGTNDVKRTEVDLAAYAADVESIAAAVEVDEVVVAAIPPYEASAAQVVSVNAVLVELAQRNGWIFIDPWGAYRSGDAWGEGGSPDGTHGSTLSYESAGRSIAFALLEQLETTV